MAAQGQDAGQGDIGAYAPVHERGKALFIINTNPKENNGKFEFQTRDGANEDSANLQMVFINTLGFEWINPDCHEDLTTKQWDHRKGAMDTDFREQNCTCMICRIRNTDHSKSKCFVLAISSHGREITETEIIFSDGNSILLTEIFEALSEKNCPTLKGKPRIIILQVCRANFRDQEKVLKMQDKGVPVSVMVENQSESGSMAKSRAEIQRQYRERKKQLISTFLENERKRQKQYRTPAGLMKTKERKKKNEAEKRYCAKYRAKIKEMNMQCKSAESPCQVQSSDISSSTDHGETSGCNVSQQTVTRSNTSPGELFVRFDFNRRQSSSSSKKKQKSALSTARSKVQKLKQNNDTLQKLTWKYKKRCQRMNEEQNKCSENGKTVTGENLTPNSKAHHDIREAGLKPRSLPKSIVRKLVMGNAVCAEIQEVVQQNPQQSKRAVIKRVFSGRIVKKYRCLTLLKKETGVRVRAQNNNEKRVEFTKRFRNLRQKNHLKKQVQTFYERDDVSRCMPGKQDVTKGSDGHKKQTRILHDYLSNLHEKFCAESEGTKCSLSQFCKLRPRHVKLTSLISRNTCLCTSHQNMALKLKCLRSVNVNISPNPEVVSKAVDLDQMKTLLSGITDEDVDFESWQRVLCKDGKHRMRVVKTTQKLQEFIVSTTKQYELFLQHVERVRHQYKSAAELKANLPMNEVVVQMDFTENFACQSADEIQSAYWNSTNVTLHPVVAHRKSQSGNIEHKNYVFISDVNQHNSRAVIAFIQKLVPLIKADLPTATKIHYWTDSPTSQYRNRYIFDILCRHETMFGIKAVWNYFESGHGKGPCDGIGGSAKRQASDAVKQGKVSIQDATEFFEWASTHEKKIKYVFYSQEEYDAADALIKERNACPITGTLRLHAVVPADSYSLYTRDVSCYCQHCLSGTLCDSWSKHQLITKEQEVNIELPGANSASGQTNSEDADDSEVKEKRKFLVETVEDHTLQQIALSKMPHDFLLVYPVVSGQKARRNERDGSWLLHGLKKIVQEKYSTSDQDLRPVNFLHLLTEVSGFIARERESIIHRERNETQSEAKPGNQPEQKEENQSEERKQNQSQNEQETKRNSTTDWVKDEEKSGFKNAVCFHHRLVQPIIFYPEKTVQELPQPF